MTPGEALRRLKAAAREGGEGLRLTRHARVRIAERHVSQEEFLKAIASACLCRWSEEHDSWTAVGTTPDADRLRVAFSVEPDVVVITVIWE